MEINNNDLGFINFSFNDFKIDNIYSFIHLLDEPNFTHLNNDSTISNKSIDKTLIKYDKKFVSTFSINTKHNIHSQENCLVWNFETESAENGDFCFGITLPVFCDKVWLPDNSIGHKIINYSNMWIPPYLGQSNIDLPIIKVQLHDNTFAAIMSNFDHGSHFYAYCNGSQNYIKIGTKSIDSLSSTIKIKIINENDSLTDLYKSMYPEAASKIDFWKIVFSKIEKLYNINVYYDKSFNKRNVTGDIPSIKNVILYSEIMWQELSKYPASFFRSSNIRGIYLCENLCSSQGICYGMTIGDHVVLNIESDLIESIKRNSLHHELYHCIEKQFSTEHKNDLIVEWNKLEKSGFILQKSLNTEFLNHEDVRAELFSYIMSDPQEIEERSLTDNSLIEATQIIKKFVGFYHPSISMESIVTKSHDHQKIVEQIVYRKDVEQESMKNLLLDYDFSIKNQKPTKHLIITGILGSGLQLTKTIFDDLKYFDLVELSNINNLPVVQDDYNLIYVVRNPSDLAGLYKDKNNQDILDLWLSINRKLIDNKLPFIRYEDIITGNQAAFSKLLNSIGHHGSHEFNYNLVNENKTSKYSPISRIHLNKKLSKRIELLWFGYQHFI